MSVHLIGMGVVGSVIAWHLHLAGIAFTWSDANNPITAWRACTGSVLPTKDPLDKEGYALWSEWFQDPPWGHPGIIEPGSYVYNHLRPPEGGCFKQVSLGSFRLADIPSYHVNAQALVECACVRFAHQKRVTPPAKSRPVVTHGSSSLLAHYVWGWHALGLLEVPWPTLSRACLYFRHHRFRLTYAYPKPGTKYHYLGSDMIAQRNPHSLDLTKRLAVWQKFFAKIAGPGISVQAVPGSLVEGWRPTSKPSLPLLVYKHSEQTLYVRPLGHSGVRWSHCAAQALLAWLK